MKKPLRIVTRKSPLARWQAEFVEQQLLAQYPDLQTTIVETQTEGDRILDKPLAKIGGKGLFVKTLEEYLLQGKADIAVHSLKDMPTTQPPGLELSVILKRTDPRDALIGSTLEALPPQARVGTSSLRRQAQLLTIRPDCIPTTLRGNVNTRLRKLDEGEFDVIILAASGLQRIGLESRITQYLSTDLMLPAIGQGALCIECRQDDEQTHQLIAPLRDETTTQCTLAERALLLKLDGNCQSPIAGFATCDGTNLTLEGRILTPDGTQKISARVTGNSSDPIAIGKQVADQLIEQGALSIIEACQTT